MKIDIDYFRKEYLAFRGIMCSVKYSTGQIFDALLGLLHVYLRLDCKLQDKNDAKMIMESLLQVELPRRMALRESMVLDEIGFEPG